MHLDNDSTNNGKDIQRGSKISYFREAFEWLEVLIISLALAILIKTFVFQFIVVEGPSMENTLKTGDRLFVNRIGYYFSGPKRGDIVVFQHRPGPMKFFPILFEEDFIKRVIAVEGETVNIRDGKVYVDNVIIDEPYVHDPTLIQGMNSMNFPVTVPKSTLFVLGDNRVNSKDSRYRDVGFVELKKMKGKATFRVWPLNRMGVVK